MRFSIPSFRLCFASAGLAVALAALTPLSAQAQTSQAWATRHDQGGALDETARKTVVDASGNFYVTGESNGNIVTAKFDSAGSHLWTARYSATGDSTQGVTGIAVDGGGNVYVCGYTWDGFQDDALLVKYNASGALQWDEVYDGPGSGNDVAHGVAIDGSGNVLVAGRAADLASDDMMILKYSAAGALTWDVLYDGAGSGADGAFAVAADATGRVAVTGFTTNASTQAVFTTLLLNSSGSVTWADVRPNVGSGLAVAINGTAVAATGYDDLGPSGQRALTVYVTLSGASSWASNYEGPNLGNDRGVSIRFDSAGRPLVAGYGQAPGGRDILTIRYSTAGAADWEFLYAGTGGVDDEGFAIGTDSADSMLVAGYSHDGTSRKLTILKYSAAGVPQWDSFLVSSGGSADRGNFVGVDGSGAVVVGGQALGGALTGNDFVVAKYNSATGAAIFETIDDLGGGTEDSSQAVAVDKASGATYVAGTTVTVGGQDALLVKYDTAGLVAWSRTYNGPAGGNDAATSVAVDSSGNVIIAGYARTAAQGENIFVQKFNSAGALQWTQLLDGGASGDDAAYGVGLDSAGNVYVGGRAYTGGATNWDYLTAKYSAAGALQWAQTANGSGSGYDEATAIAVDASGNSVVTGYSWNGSDEDVVTIKYTTAGATSWTRVFNGPGTGVDAGWDVEISSTGNVLVAGQTWNGTSDDVLTLQYSTSGTLNWSRLYNGSGNDFDAATSIAVDGANNAFVAGYAWRGASDFDFATLRYDIGGTLLWSSTYNGQGNGEDIAWGVAIDSAGNPYVTGQAEGLTGLNFATLRYVAGSGATAWPASGGIFHNGAAIFDGGVLGSDSPAGIALDSADNVYVGGTSRGAGTASDTMAVKCWAQASLANFIVSPTILSGGSVGVGMLTLSQAAPAGGIAVAISSNSPAAIVPATVTVPAGQTTHNFNVNFVNNSYVKVFPVVTASLSNSIPRTIEVRPSNYSQFISQTVPTSMVAGQTYTASIVYKNVGGTTWTAAQGYKLQSKNPSNNMTWGRNRLGLLATTAPNANGTFQGPVYAPENPGTYNFQWQTHHENMASFGPLTPNVPVVVSLVANAARWKGQTVPTTVSAGNDFSASIVMRNVGTDTWTTAAGYYLRSRNPIDNTFWGTKRWDLPSGASIPRGTDVTFTRFLSAPILPGTYNFQWSMNKTGVGQFGDLTGGVAIVVTNGPNNAQFVSNSGVPTTIARGTTFTASVTMKNLGTATWTPAGNYVLQSRNPANNTNWGVSQIAMTAGSSVPTNSNYTFTQLFTAPATPGTYNFQWRMAKPGTNNGFGEVSANVAIVVT